MQAVSDIGLVGLAVMGENLVLNMESKGFHVSVFNRTVEKVDKFINGRGKGKNFYGAHSLGQLVRHEDTGEEFKIVFLERCLALRRIVFLFPTEALGVDAPVFAPQSAHQSELATIPCNGGIEGMHIVVVDEAVEVVAVFCHLSIVVVSDAWCRLRP